MEVRDKLNTADNYKEIIKRNNGFIQEEIDDQADYNSQNDQEKILFTYQTILRYQIDNLVAKYSLNIDIDSITADYSLIIPTMEKGWEKEGGYVSMLWMLSMK